MNMFAAVNGVVFVGVEVDLGRFDGNMPAGISGGGVPETEQYNPKGNCAFIVMDDWPDGDDAIDTDDGLGMPVMNGMPAGKLVDAFIRVDKQAPNFAEDGLTRHDLVTFAR